MKKQTLTRLIIVSFKGIQKLDIKFNHNEQNITGPNESGKSTIFDAFSWLITDKDSNDSADFSVKRLVDGQPLEKVDCLVEGHFVDQDGIITIIKKEYVENWGKRGEKRGEFLGNTNKYTWNDAPLSSEREFKKRIEEMFGGEKSFKLLTNPLFFAGKRYPWKERRDLLLDMAGGDITNEYILAKNPNLQEVIDQISRKDISDLRSENKGKRDKIYETLELIPARIDEATRSKPTPVDTVRISSEINTIENRLKEIQESESDIIAKNEKANAYFSGLQNEVYELSNKNLKLENDCKIAFTNETNESQSIVKNLQDQLANTNQRILDGKNYLTSLASKHKFSTDDIEARIQRKKDELQQLSAEFDKVSADKVVFDENELTCSLCGREHDPDVKEDHRKKAIEKFNTEKAKSLNSINERGGAAKKVVEQLNTQLIDEQTKYNEAVAKYEKSIAELEETAAKMQDQIKPILESNGQVEIEPVESRLKSTDHQQNADKIEKLKTEIASRNTEKLDSLLIEERAKLNNELIDLKTELKGQEQIKAADARIKELKDQEKSLNDQLSEIDGVDYSIDQYETFKYTELQKKVNAMFEFVNFKMFNKLVNGGYEPTCVPTFKDVPFDDVNTAGKIFSGIDIINTLSKHFGICLPIFLDNRESTTNIPHTDSQVINLQVGGTQLVIE